MAHDVDDFVALGLKNLKIISIKLYGQLTLYPADCLFHVVFDRLREIPENAGNLFKFAIHRDDEPLLVVAENWSPLLFRFEIDKVFRIEETSGVGSIVWPSDLTGDHGCLGK